MKIKLSKVSKYYDKQVLNKLDIELNNIHSIGIIGASGCGKSTLLRLLSGLEYPEEGTISINDLVISPKNSKLYQENIGYVFQKHNLFPHLSIKDNIVLILNKIRKINKDAAEQMAIEVLKKLHLTKQMNQLPNNMSGGQAQRASIARALSTNPKMIFLDEPTAALDPVLTKEVLKAIKELKDSGKEFVFVTHEIDFLKQFADYVIFLDDGNIVEHGKIDCLSNPKTEKLTRFLEGEL
ncbi:MAG: amino acid ABC transporter ATP-binding protein [Cellulosilyticaceae bacterium]